MSDHHDKVSGKACCSHDSQNEEAKGKWWTTRQGRLIIACGLAICAAWLTGRWNPALDHWAFVAAMAIGLVPIALRALNSLWKGAPFSIEMLMTIAAIGAVIIGAAEEAAAVVLLFMIGEMLEGVAAGKARASIQNLMTLVPKTALLEVDGKTQEVQADSLAIDSIILVRPGDRIPADGIIISGESSIDEAPVTGESIPKRKVTTDQVFAGTVNLEATLRIRVTAAASDNTIARVIRLVEDAQSTKAPTQRFIDRFSTYYTPGVVLVAAVVVVIPPLLFGALWSEWIYKGLAILLIGCPCALVISTPAAIAASLSAGARRGLLIKGGAVLELLGKVQVAAFDKTGTLTEGKPRVTDVIGFGGQTEQSVIRMAASLEAGSSHPLAKAILAKAGSDSGKNAEGIAAIAGKGLSGTLDGQKLLLVSPKAAAESISMDNEQARVEALNDEGKSVSILIIDGKLAGIIAMRDEPRPDAKEGLKMLTDSGIKTIMLTGDNQRTGKAIGKLLDIDVKADLLPQDKQAIVRELKSKGQVVVKVGDGINDAPALAEADIGIAMGGGTDVALETADAAILHGRVKDVAAMIQLSQRAMTNIHQNITIALGLKAVFLVTTIIGITGLWPAILADTGATVLVTVNALRLLKVKA